MKIFLFNDTANNISIIKFIKNYILEMSYSLNQCKNVKN